MAFLLEKKAGDAWSEIHLINAPEGEMETAQRIVIIPDCGAHWHAWHAGLAGSNHSLILGYENGADFHQNVATKGFRSCKMSPFACRVLDAHYSFQQQSYTLSKFLWDGSALHGILYDAVFRIRQEDVTDQYACVQLETSYTGSDPGFPFHYDCLVTYFLDHQGLELSTTLINRGHTDMPIMDGWHPYFTFGKPIDSLELQFHASAEVLLNEQLVPSGELASVTDYREFQEIGSRNFDNCFVLDFSASGDGPVCRLRDPQTGIEIAVRPDTSYPYLQLYNPDDRQSLAIENLSAAPNAFNNGMGLRILEPSEQLTFKTRYSVSIPA